MKELIRFKFKSNVENMNNDIHIVNDLEQYIINNFKNIELSTEKIYKKYDANTNVLFMINILCNNSKEIGDEITKVLRNNLKSDFFEPITCEKDNTNFINRYKFSGKHTFLNF